MPDSSSFPDAADALAATVATAHGLAEAGAVFAGWLLLLSDLECADYAAPSSPAESSELLRLHCLALEVFAERWWWGGVERPERETALLRICAGRALQQAYALAVERGQRELALWLAETERGTAHGAFPEGADCDWELVGRPRAAELSLIPDTLLPVHELEALSLFTARATQLAKAGRLADGYTLLLTGWERAKFHAAAAWGAALVQNWSEVLLAYCECFGIGD